jgi:hypothetical protein
MRGRVHVGRRTASASSLHPPSVGADGVGSVAACDGPPVPSIASCTSSMVGNRRGLGGGCGGGPESSGWVLRRPPGVNGRTTPITATPRHSQIHHAGMAFSVADPPETLATYTPRAPKAPLRDIEIPRPKRGKSRYDHRRRFAPGDWSFLPTLPSIRVFDREHTGMPCLGARMHGMTHAHRARHLIEGNVHVTIATADVAGKLRFAGSLTLSHTSCRTPNVSSSVPRRRRRAPVSRSSASRLVPG